MRKRLTDMSEEELIEYVRKLIAERDPNVADYINIGHAFVNIVIERDSNA